MSLKIILFITLTAFTDAGKVDAAIGENPYTGTWHYENGNQLFIVKLWPDGQYTMGHYKMVEYNNGIIGATIFTSEKDYGDGIIFPKVITGLIQANVLSGSICDNTIQNYSEDCRKGKFIMQVQLLSSPNTATWKVSNVQGLKVGVEPPFSVPTDIILTKVSNEVICD